jgi:hypothetical protein
VGGNNFSLIGTPNDECDDDDDDWAILSGTVTINGNNATFKNIKFTGDIFENGQNTRFINCCFKMIPCKDGQKSLNA